MCDETTIDDIKEYRRRLDLTRRRFGALSVGAGLAMILPASADAMPVTETDVEIETPDGKADCYFVHPTTGIHSGVLVWPDAMGLRPAFRKMARRLAESGYSVLVINPYYRDRKAPIVSEGWSFEDDETRNMVMSMMATLNKDTNLTDAAAFISYLDKQVSVDKNRKMGTIGYCMGGAMTMRTAAAYPTRIGAGASFHGGRLVTDGPDSPHLLISRMRAHYLFAIAENDDSREPETKNVLREAFANARLPAEIEVYEGAMHGWCPPDTAVYNEQQAERAWGRLLALFETALS